MFFDKWQANEECVSVRAVYQCIFVLHMKPDTCVCLLMIGKKRFVEIKVVVLPEAACQALSINFLLETKKIY